MPIYLGDTLIYSGGSCAYDFKDDSSGMVVAPLTVMYPMDVAWYEYVEMISPSGAISDLPTDIKHVYSTIGMTGDLADLPASVVGVYIQSSEITGDVGADILPTVTYINLYNCPAITCDLATLGSNLTVLNLASNPLVSGVYTPGAGIKNLTLDATNMSASDTDNTLIALDFSGAVNGVASLCTNRTAASDAAVASLTLKGWILMI